MTDIIDVNYAPQDGRVRIDIVGLPGMALLKSLEICDAMFGTGNWVYISIDGRRQSGAELPGDFTTKIIAERCLG